MLQSFGMIDSPQSVMAQLSRRSERYRPAKHDSSLQKSEREKKNTKT